jgi:hypothetical protein
VRNLVLYLGLRRLGCRDRQGPEPGFWFGQARLISPRTEEEEAMATYAVDPKTKDELVHLHRGVHSVIDNLINKKNYAEAERVLRGIEARLDHLIRTVKVVPR